MIDRSEYEFSKARLEVYEAWAKQYRKPNGWTVIPAGAAEAAGLGDVTNEMRSAVEVFEFFHDKPERYFLYVDEAKKLATTWTGESLGSICFGREWRDSFGGRRQSITFRAINGRTYFGTYSKSSGNYARVKLRAA